MELNKTIEVREGEALPLDAVEAIFKDVFPHLSGPPVVRQFPSGQSNLTYLIEFGGQKFVLRRPPFGTKPKSGHSMIREFRVMNALKPVFSAVPQTYFHRGEEESPLGAEFYVMELVEGLKLGRNLPEGVELSAAGAEQLGYAFMDKLIALHSVDYTAIGLADFGRPEGYVRRQIEGWIERFGRARTADLQDFGDVTDWLVAHMPSAEARHAILHGDYRLDNLILDPHNLSDIRAVLDWEISALGDPLMDLGNTLAYWIEANDHSDIRSLRMQPSDIAGMPDRSALIQYYGEKTGLDVANFDYYLVYGVFRLAAIMQQIYYRYYHGQTKNPAFKVFASQVAILGAHARRLISAA